MFFCCSAKVFHRIADIVEYTCCCHFADTRSPPNEVQILTHGMSRNQADYVTQKSRSPLEAHSASLRPT